MTLPRITEDCLAAIIDKAVQEHPQIFAATTMLDLKIEQPELCFALTSLLKPFLDAKPDEGTGGIPVEQAQEMILVSSFCLVGIVFKALKAQIEAAEMNDAWA